MIIKEYRILLPFTVEEFKLGQLYMVSKASLDVTRDGEGIEVLASKPAFEKSTGRRGTFTHKRVHLDGKIPKWARAFIPNTAVCVEESAWNCYPYTRTNYLVPFFGDSLLSEVESVYLNDRGTSENALNLSEEELAIREVDVIDLLNETLPGFDTPGTDMRVVNTNRTPLRDDTWPNAYNPVMCLYKVCRVNYRTRIPGLASKAEKYLQKVVFRDTFFRFHRLAILWCDEWLDLTPAQIRRFELFTMICLKQQFKPDYLPKMNQDGKCGDSDELDDDVYEDVVRIEWSSHSSEDDPPPAVVPRASSTSMSASASGSTSRSHSFSFSSRAAATTTVSSRLVAPSRATRAPSGALVRGRPGRPYRRRRRRRRRSGMPGSGSGTEDSMFETALEAPPAATNHVHRHRHRHRHRPGKAHRTTRVEEERPNVRPAAKQVVAKAGGGKANQRMGTGTTSMHHREWDRTRSDSDGSWSSSWNEVPDPRAAAH